MLTHNGYRVPYQLHWPPLTTEEDDELTTLELEDTTELEDTLLRDDELELTTLDELTEELVPPVHAAPFTVGLSTVPLLVTPWKPNSTVCPG